MTYVDERRAVAPHRLSKPLNGELAKICTARNGDYRILFDIEEQQQAVAILRVSHRAHIYRPAAR